MKSDTFDQLLASVTEGAEILSGRRKPTRVRVFSAPDVRAVRDGYGLSQSRFAALMGISIATLRNWEQGRRRPEGSARVLLEVVAKHPDAVLDAVRHPAKVRRRA
jgi:putative transcriptional regulator